jgi:hypothetical protein
MKITRRKLFLIFWAISIISAGILVSEGSGVSQYGWAVFFSLIALSIGVPLMRAFTEFSK